MCQQAHSIRDEVTAIFTEGLSLLGYHVVSISHCFKWSWCSHHQGKAFHEESPEMLATFCPLTQQHIPEYLSIMHTRCLYQHI